MYKILEHMTGTPSNKMKLMNILENPERRPAVGNITAALSKSIFKSIDKGFSKTDVKPIYASLGKIRTFDHYMDIKDAIKSLSKFTDGLKSGQEYMVVIKKQMAFLETNAATFSGGFKRNNKPQLFSNRKAWINNRLNKS